MKRLMLLTAVFGIGAILGATGCFMVIPRHECPIVQTGLTLHDPQYTTFIFNRIKTLEWPNADGTLANFRIDSKDTPNRTLTLKGKELLTIPDHHGVTKLALVDVRNNTARLLYMTTFNHRSFGRNLVTVDCGIVDLTVQEAQQ